MEHQVDILSIGPAECILAACNKINNRGLKLARTGFKKMVCFGNLPCTYCHRQSWKSNIVYDIKSVAT